MKTKYIRLIVTMITLSAVITVSSIPAEAQRRNTRNERSNKTVVKKSNNKTKRPAQKVVSRSGSIKKNQVKKSTARNKSRVIDRAPGKIAVGKSYKAPKINNQRTKKTPLRKRYNAVKRAPDVNNKKDINKTPRKINSSRVKAPKRNTQRTRQNPVRTRTQDTERADISKRKRNNKINRDITRNNAERNINREIRTRTNRKENRIDRNKPARRYKGSDRFWTENNRSFNHKSNKFKPGKYWNHRWEKFRWNEHSWRDYYKGYNRFTYKMHRHYYHHNRFGHCIKRFAIRPPFFLHNQTRYYCYDGNFFRYHRGIGYVLAELPVDIVFSELPFEYERVFINGYLYFRVGNLFFEHNGYGFSLVHYPERYYAYSLYN